MKIELESAFHPIKIVIETPGEMQAMSRLLAVGRSKCNWTWDEKQLVEKLDKFFGENKEAT